MTVFTLAFSLFFIMNSIGNIPIFVSVLSKFRGKKQRAIIFREMLIALGFLVLFTFFVKELLYSLGISTPVIGMGGGIVLFFISIGMIFPKQANLEEFQREEPLIVPLAMPLVAGPGALTTVMVYSDQVSNQLLVTASIAMAWIPSLLILLSASYLKNLLGTKGLNALQRLGGMLICLLAVQMISSSCISLIKSSFQLS